jgi:competence protein ComGC/Arc/MetJ-type ribon-helix-helix transcriptional regulator
MGYMNKRLWVKRVVTGALLGGLLLSSVGFAYASDNNSVSTAVNNAKTKIKSMMPGGRGPCPGMGMEKGMGMNLDLATLVKDGIITSAESDAIQAKINTLQADRKAEMDKIKAMTDEERQAYFESKKSDTGEKTDKTDFLTTLVNDKIISSDTAAAIRKAEQEQRTTEMQNMMTEKLTALVTDKTITSEQSDAIVAALKEEQTTRQAEMDKVKDMTQAEREAYFQNNKPAKEGFLADLVTAGTITQAQADAVQKAFGGSRNEGKGTDMQTMLTDKLTALVTDNTITSEQSDAIIAALKEEQTARQAEMEKVKAMTQAEREAYFQNNKPAKEGFLADLVTAGTITQAQADAVQKAIGGFRGEGKGPGGMGHGNMDRGHKQTSSNASQSDTE